MSTASRTANAARAFSGRSLPFALLPGLCLLLGATAAFAQSPYVQDVSGGSSLTASSSIDYTTFTLGNSYADNLLTISGSTTVVTASDTVVIGNTTNSDDNAMTVTGGATFTSTVSGMGKFVTLGLQGGSNELTISSGGIVNAQTMFRIGFQSDGNILTVTGSGSLLSITGAPASAHLCIAGNSGANNLVQVLNSGSISAPAVRIGGMAGATTLTNDNTLWVSGAGSYVTVEENLYIGVNYGGSLQNITGNNLEIDSFGMVVVDGDIQINPYTIAGDPQNFIRIGESGMLFWADEHVGDFEDLISDGYVQIPDGVGGWVSVTDPGYFQIGYNALTDYTMLAYSSN
jgi:hypothetical protein